MAGDADTSNWPCGACHLHGCPGDAQGRGCTGLPPDPLVDYDPAGGPPFGGPTGGRGHWVACLGPDYERCDGECGG
jgi:hypothetical protein